jgi:transcriptional regulator with XRE-family HTH domain
MDEELRAAQAALGLRLRGLRKAAGLTQQELAVAALASRSSIACIETGRQNPDRTFWERADEATGSAGILVAGYEDLRMLARRRALSDAFLLDGAAAADVPDASAELGRPGIQDGPAFDVRAVLGPFHTGAVRAGDLPTRSVPQGSLAGNREHTAADRGGTGPAVFPAERSHELFVARMRCWRRTIAARSRRRRFSWTGQSCGTRGSRRPSRRGGT